MRPRPRAKIGLVAAVLGCPATAPPAEPSPAPARVEAEVAPAPPTTPASAAVQPVVRPASTTRARAVPADVLRSARADLRFVEQDPCMPPSAFASFTSEPARWMRFTGASGRLEAMVQCTELAAPVRVDLYPEDDPDRRYVVFLAEDGVALEERRDGAWERICDGPCTAEVDADTRRAWNEGYDPRALGRATLELLAALPLPEQRPPRKRQPRRR